MAVAETGEKPFNNRTPPRAGAETSSRKSLPWPRRRLEARMPVGAFLLASCPAPPVDTRTLPPLPCSGRAPRKEVVLAPRSQTAAFEPPRRRARHRRTSPAAAVLPRLVTTFALPLTSLSSIVPKPTAVRPGSRPGTVSVPRDDFGGPNTEAPPYPPAAGVCSSAPSPERLTGKPFRASRG
jgi:hypothetical protein